MNYKKKIAIILIATDKYIDLIPNLKESIDKYFLQNYQKTIFVFNDNDLISDVENIKINHLPWPMNTLMRFHYISMIKNKLNEYDYIYYMDSDIIVNDIIDEEIFPMKNEIVSTKHFHFQTSTSIGPYEFENKNSLAYVEKSDVLQNMYCQACFFGSSKTSFINMVDHIKDEIETDLKNNIIPIWHDESYFNKYILTHTCKRLHSGYCHSPRWGKKDYTYNIKLIHNELHSI